jgi:hypothetical protein
VYVVEDETHMLLVCPLYSNLRQKYGLDHIDYSTERCVSLLAICNEKAMLRLAAFVYHAFELRKNYSICKHDYYC